MWEKIATKIVQNKRKTYWRMSSFCCINSVRKSTSLKIFVEELTGLCTYEKKRSMWVYIYVYAIRLCCTSLFLFPYMCAFFWRKQLTFSCKQVKHELRTYNSSNTHKKTTRTEKGKKKKCIKRKKQKLCNSIKYIKRKSK